MDVVVNVLVFWVAAVYTSSNRRFIYSTDHTPMHLLLAQDPNAGAFCLCTGHVSPTAHAAGGWRVQRRCEKGTTMYRNVRSRKELAEMVSVPVCNTRV